MVGGCHSVKRKRRLFRLSTVDSGRSRAARSAHPTIRAYAAFLPEISVGLRRETARPSPAHLHRHRGVQLSQAPGRSGYCRRRVWRRHGHPARQQRPAALTAFSCSPARWRVRPWARRRFAHLPPGAGTHPRGRPCHRRARQQAHPPLPKRRGVITLVTAPGHGEVTVVTDETMGEKDPLLARLLAAATAGASPAGPAHKRAPVRIVLDPDATPVAKGKLCGQLAGFCCPYQPPSKKRWPRRRRTIPSACI